MEQFFDWVERSFIPWAGRLSGNKYMTAIRETFYRLIPFMIVLYGFRIIQWAALDPEGPVMGENGMGLGAAITGGLYGEEYRATAFYRLAQLFSEAMGISYILLLFFLTMTLAIQLTKIWGGDKSLAAFCALGGFFMFMQMEAEVGPGAAEVFGHPPLRVPSAYLFGALSARILSWLDRFPGLRLRVPESLPERVAKPLERCIPAALTLVSFLLLCIVATQLFVFFHREFDSFVTSVFRPASQTLPFALLYQLATWLLWWCGLFGDGFIELVHDFAYWPAQLANQASAAAAVFLPGDSLVRGFVFTSEFFRTADVHVLALAASVLVFSANRRLRNITWFMLPFLVFNISVPFYFCLPVVLNPAILLPFLMAPLANTVVAWAAISWGVVPVFKFATAGTVPVILSGVLGTGSLMGGVLHLVVFVLDLFIYAPFVIVSNRIDEAKEGGTKHGQIG